MTTLATLRSDVQELIGRTDYTDTQTDRHINRALRRTQSIAQIRDMEAAVNYTLDGYLTATIPSDHRHTRYMFFPTAGERGIIMCEKIDLSQLNNYKHINGTSSDKVRPYYRLRDTWYFPTASSGEIVTCVYYAAWDALSDDADYNELTVLSPEAIVFGAASFACTFFRDERVKEMEERYHAAIEELQTMIWNEDVGTGSTRVVSPVVDETAYVGGY